MTAISRRSLLIGGGSMLGAAVVGAAAGVEFQRHRPAAAAAAEPVPAAIPAPTAAPTTVPSDAAEVLGTTPITGLGDPERLLAFGPLLNSAVTQDLVLLPGAGVYFVTQKTVGSNGSALPYESTIINRIRASDGVALDSMTLVDGGHGLGFEAQQDGDSVWIWMTWHGASADSGWREQDFVRLRYAPGTWQRGTAVQQLGLTVLPFQDRTPEAVYHFDWAKDFAVERHWDPPQAGQASTETFVRRRISDIEAGKDRRLDEIRLRATPPTTQGFATVNDTLFRWLGAAAVGGAVNAADPIALEQYSWTTGQLVTARVLPTIWAPWQDGVCEPQGLSTYREADGSASLLLGTATGGAGHHAFQVSRFARIGVA